MKRFCTLLLTLAALTTFSACDDGDNTPPAGNGLPAGYDWARNNDAVADGWVNTSMLFFGRAEVETIATGERFVDEKARFELVPSEAQAPAEQRTLALFMHETRFADKMPPLEMEAYGIRYTPAAGWIDVEAEQVVPRIAGTPYERYVLTEIDGQVRDVELSLTFVCAGTYRVEYTGRLIVPAAD